MVDIQKMFEAVLCHDAKTILDIGCGHCRILKDIPIPIKVGVDIFRPYLEWSKDTNNENIIYLNMDAKNLKRHFLDDSFDVVSLIDVVEHFSKRDGLRLLKRACKIAKKQVLSFVPMGHDPQDKDVFGMGGDEYQKHRSEWFEKDLINLGFETILLKKFHTQKDIDALIAYKDLQ